MLERTWKNCVLAARVLARSPAFTLTAVLSVALGIGATTSIFTLVNAALLRPRPGIADPHTLLDIGRADRGRAGFDTVSYPNYVDFRDRATQLTSLAAYDIEPQAVALGGRDSAERIFVQVVSANYFSTLGARPSLGRFFAAAEDRPGAEPAVVLSHTLWVQRYGGDPRVLSRPIVLNGVQFRVAGIAGPRFQGATALAPDAWLPISARLQLWGSAALLTDRRASWLILLGRLKAPATVGQAEAELSVIASDLERTFPRENKGRSIRVFRSSRLPGQIGTAVGAFLALLMAVSAIVLLLACVNLAGLLLARASTRTREIAIRLAIGGARGAIVAQLVTETLLVFALAAPAGLAVAIWMTDAVAGFIPRLPLPLVLDLSLDARVLAFSFFATLACGLVTGLVPALQASRPQLLPALRGDEKSGPGALRFRNALVSAQVALSCVLLVTAGLFARTLQRAAIVDPGFDAASVQTVTIDLSLARHSEASGRMFADRLLERVRALPRVRHAAFARDLPFDGGRMSLGGVTLPGRPLPSDSAAFGADWNVVSPGYFRTMGIPILSGRDFNERDRADSTRVAIINQSTARMLWPGQEPVGQWFELQGFDGDKTLVQVAGVAKDIKYESLDEAAVPFIYAPFAQQYQAEITLHMAAEPGENLTAAVRAILRDLDPNLPIVRTATMEQVIALKMLPQRMAALVAGALGLVGLLLATIGIYGVTAYLIGRRTREIGIRMALGARPIDIIMRVLVAGARLAVTGLAVGLLLSLVVSRLLSAFLLGVAASDPVAYTGAAALLGVSALAACYLPARRSAAVDPARTLRNQ